MPQQNRVTRRQLLVGVAGTSLASSGPFFMLLRLVPTRARSWLPDGADRA